MRVGRDLICILRCYRAILDVSWPTLQPKLEVAQRGCLDEVCWAAAHLGSGLSKQKPSQTTLSVEPPSICIPFRSSNSSLCASLDCGILERRSFLLQGGCVPPLPKCTYHALVSLDVVWPSRCDGGRELGCFPWLCCCPERQTWKHTLLICCNKIRWVQDVGLLWKQKAAMVLTWCVLTGYTWVPEIHPRLLKANWCKRMFCWEPPRSHSGRGKHAGWCQHKKRGCWLAFHGWALPGHYMCLASSHPGPCWHNLSGFVVQGLPCSRVPLFCG